MLNWKKGACCIAAVMLCAGMMTGCGNADSTSAGTESVSSADASAESKADEQNAANAAAEADTDSDEDTADAEEILKVFLDGCRNNDLDAVLEVADYQGLYQALEGSAFSEDAFRQEMQANLCDMIDDYSINEVTSKPEDLDTFNMGVKSFIEELHTEPETPDNEQTLRLVEYARDTVKPADARIAFSVTINHDGTDSEGEYVLIRIGDKWQLDLITETVMLIYLNRENVSGETAE